jgi:hypothetical protein
MSPGDSNKDGAQKGAKEFGGRGRKNGGEHRPKVYEQMNECHSTIAKRSNTRQPHQTQSNNTWGENHL